jgi:hypothetical protein
MKSQLAWPRVLRDIGIILFVAAALLVAIEVGLLHGAETASGSSPPAAHAPAAGVRTN